MKSFEVSISNIVANLAASLQALFNTALLNRRMLDSMIPKRMRKRRERIMQVSTIVTPD
jgi:hypothetical protein